MRVNPWWESILGGSQSLVGVNPWWELVFGGSQSLAESIFEGIIAWDISKFQKFRDWHIFQTETRINSAKDLPCNELTLTKDLPLPLIESHINSTNN